MPTLGADDIGFILGLLGLLGVLFSVYNYFRKPQEDIETKQALSDKELGTKASILAQKEMETKASLLAQQVEWEKASNEKKFSEMGLRIADAFTLAQNHTHGVELKVDVLIGEINILGNKMTELSTIISERIPKK